MLNIKDNEKQNLEIVKNIEKLKIDNENLKMAKKKMD